MTGPAIAGGFAVREQSTSGLGGAFAGIAVGTDLSSMYWNPAATANVSGTNSETHATLVLPDSTITATSATLTTQQGTIPLSAAGLGSESGDLSGPALVGASYYNMQVNQQLFFGLAVTSPFGFITKPDNTHWAGETFAQTSQVFSLNVTPTVAYKVSPQLTIGAGLQVQYTEVTLSQAVAPSPASPTARVQGYDLGAGVTAGLTWTPVPGTSIGAGYRSAIGVNLDGKATAGSLPTQHGLNNFAGVGAETNFYLPDMVTLSLRQRLDSAWTLLGTVEWTNWSRMGQINVISQGAGGYTVVNPATGLPVPQFGPNSTIKTLNLNWNDGWFFSGGLEYKANPNWTFRGGAAWELSPIDSSNRDVFLPDSNRFWLTGGLTHKLSEKITMDFAYAHIFFEDAPINKTGAIPGVGTVSLQAVGHTDIDLISASLKYHWGGPSASLEEPYK